MSRSSTPMVTRTGSGDLDVDSDYFNDEDALFCSAVAGLSNESFDNSPLRAPKKRYSDKTRGTPSGSTPNVASSFHATRTPESNPFAKELFATAVKKAASSASATRRQNPIPITPSKTPAKYPVKQTPVDVSSTIRKELAKIDISDSSSPSPPAKRLFVKPLASKSDEKRKMIVVGDTDSDTEELFTDTDCSPINPSSNSSFAYPLSGSNSSFSFVSSQSSSSGPSSQEGKLDRHGANSSPQKARTPFTEGVPLKSTFFCKPNTQLTSDAPISTTPPLPVATTQSVTPATPIPESVTEFCKKSLSTKLDSYIIAHCSTTQSIFEDHNIAWGTQYELARGVTHCTWTWEQVREQVPNLTGPNTTAAYKVRAVMRGKAIPLKKQNFAVWAELDREQDAIKENLSRGLGLMGPWKGDPDWHGGQVQQLAQLVKVNGSLKVQLEPLEKRRSHRFARFYGSRRIIQLRIPDDMVTKDNATVKQFLSQKFILLGRIFVPFHSKDGGVYMVETDQNSGRIPKGSCGDQYRLSFDAFMRWHNPLEYNFKQAASKFVTRYALGLSNSIPALEFSVENIIFIRDIYAEDWHGEDHKAPAEKIMTDGCGFINLTAMKIIKKKFNYDSLPTGIQGRIAGAKGMWIRHPTDDSLEPKIWIRDSQNKIKLSELDKAHRIFDLLSVSKPSSSIALSQQSILNLSFNGIPDDVLVKLLEQGIVDEVMPLLDWKRPNAMTVLWDAINKSAGVSGSRTQRVAAGASRALGFQRQDWGHDDVVADQDAETQDISGTTYTGRNEYSKAPLALHEMTMELIQAGFHPSQCKILQDKIKFMVQQTINSSVEKYRIPIKESTGGYIVADPTGLLEEGQIYYRSSVPMTDPDTEMDYFVLQGEVVLGRYPIRLPSDMQKVTAVDIPELFNWPDVIIVSTKGKFSLASLLSGGDQDGDELLVIKDKLIVDSFKNQPLTVIPSGLMESDFEREVESVPDFCCRALSLEEAASHKAFQEVLLLNLNVSQVGLYSTFHENAIWKYGYSHPETVRLAYIFCILLDSSKTGHRLKSGIFEKDRKRYVGQEEPSGILHRLLKAGRTKGDELIQAFHDACKENLVKDKAILEPYNTASNYALVTFDTNKVVGQMFLDELTRIRKHVDDAHLEFGKSANHHTPDTPTPGTPSKKSKKAKSYRATADQDDKMLAAAQKYAEPLEGIILTRDLESVMASYAYAASKSPHFAFTVAFQQICTIKAKSCKGGIAPSTREFDEARKITASFLRALNRGTDDNYYGSY
ncbi:uncharacterized protein LACBIDRAFT_301565 [Laccaria bicolor S238N-H82]|uniref:RNA-dependent RNA polymerase n=1 Tax=Laccaria bicolor (strain S238N-H82 / ATCC MYA-4686) TaxID=486041 RepID=B0CNU3_LACBS|nr:uncharacterized protein LACBIDRAFT_301565 [Laccaria bicolor S238N-H82]EDR15354.1 predicted protein [Laccaria bicolor S238N-H82]|eukprot:XP_001873562.1 predicted protein [Laccaria bicolor S238N-H82]